MSLTNQKNLKIRISLHQHFRFLSCFKMTKLKPTLFKEKKSSMQRQKFRTLLHADDENDDDNSNNGSARNSGTFVPGTGFPNISSTPSSGTASPYYLSPWNQPSPYTKSPWIQQQFPLMESPENLNHGCGGLIGSLVREEGHIYSLATCGDLLYTGSESKNIRVWKNFKDFAGFKSNSGLVKAIVVLKDKIFTGHQDGKIRVWKLSGLRKKGYRRIGSLPTSKDYFKSSINPNSYVKVRRHRNIPWNKHFDAISCMAVDVDAGLLYSGSWDKTLKVWKLSNSKCVESIQAHNDAVNSVVVGFDGLIFTGSADGTVKAWRRELVGRSTQHILVETLLRKENAVTSLTVNEKAAAVYAGSSDGLVNFWEREKHFISHGGLLRGHKLAVLCLAAAGNLVFSGSADKSICVWRREEGGVHTCMSVLTGHSGPVKCLAVEEEEKEVGDSDDDVSGTGDQRWILYSGSLDKSVMVWRVSEDAANLKKFEESTP